MPQIQTLIFAIVLLLLTVTQGWSQKPTLARLSFVVPSDQMEAFEAVFQVKIVPVLETQGLVVSSQRGRATPDSVFSRLIEFKTVPEIIEKRKAFQEDPVWRNLLEELGAAFEVPGRDGSIRNHFGPYSAPAVPRVVSAGPGKTVDAGPGLGSWREYDGTDGFGAGAVYTSFLDRDGYLWFGGPSGVSRFDGITFTNFSTKDGLAHNKVWSINQDREGNLWFGTQEGLSRFDGREFVTITTEDGLVHNSVWAIYRDRGGNLWFGTYGGVSRYDGKGWTTFTVEDGLAHNSVTSILEDREGNLWFGTGRDRKGNPKFGAGMGVSRYDGESWITFTTEDGLAHNTVRSILEDQEGNLWFGTARGVSRYDGKTWTTFGTKDGLAGDQVHSALEDREGNIWFATPPLGVSRYDGETWTPFTSKDAVGFLAIISMSQDREGQIWFPSENGFVRCYRGQNITTLSQQDGLVSSFVISMLRDREGNLWFGTDHGLSRYDGKTFTNFTTDDGLMMSYFWTIIPDREGNLWLGANNSAYKCNVSRYDGETFSTFSEEDGLAGGRIWSFFQDREGNMWMGFDHGVTRYDGSTLVNFTTEDGLADNQVFSIHQDREGNLWFATYTGGVSRYDGITFTNFTTTEGLAGNYVRSIFEDRKGNLWFGTGNGLSRYDGKGFTNFTTDDGLPANWIEWISEDRRGHLWFWTYGSGLSRYDGQVFQTLTTEDGLGGNIGRGFVEDPDGRIWLATGRGGVTCLRPPVPVPPKVSIDRVVTDRRYENVSELAIPSGTGLTVFEFSAPSLKTRPEAMVYRYRLNGYDNWQNTHARRVEYQDLPRGTYTFEVRAVDQDLVYSETPATVKLTVHPPYERIGLVSALGIAVVLIVWQTVRVIRRDRRVRVANRELDESNRSLSSANKKLQRTTGELEKARDAAEAANQAKSVFLANMSHEIRTPMNAILGYAQILQRKSTLASDDRQAIQTIHRSGDHLLKLINDVLDISKIEAGRLELQPADFDLQSLLQNLGVMFQLRCEGKRLAWQIETPEADRIPVHGDEAKISQVLINLLGNAVKFTDDGGVTLKAISLPDDRYRFEVIDTGPGISVEDREAIFEAFTQTEVGVREGSGTGLGLSIAQRLIDLMGGQLELDSTPGVGSCFSFTTPLSPARAAVQASVESEWAKVTRLAEGYRVSALVADDVQENRDVLSQLLSDIGVEVTTVENGRQAVEAVVADPPDIVFLDIRMPEMDGPEAAGQIWDAVGRERVKVVAVSASALDHEAREYLELGFDDFVPKPFRTEQIYGCLARHLGVAFEYAEAGVEADEEEPLDLEGITLPEDLYGRLREAAELYSVTELEAILKEMAQLGEAHRRLAEHLRDLSQNFKMEEILAIIEEIQ